MTSPLRAFRETAQREGDGWRSHCPYCTSSKTGRADYSLSWRADGVYFCFRCSASGRVRNASEFTDAVEEAEQAPPTEHPAMEPPEGFTPLWQGEGRESFAFAAARSYARKRQFTSRSARALGVGACVGGSWSGRLIVPVTHPDDSQHWLGYVGRDYTGKADLPYRYPRGMPRGEFLFNQRTLSVTTTKPVLVVEGVLDTVPYYPDAVAVLGKPSEHHKTSLRRASRPVCVVLDGDAWDEAWSLALDLRLHGVRAGAVRLGPRVDPDEVDPRWLWGEAERSLEMEL